MAEIDDKALPDFPVGDILRVSEEGTDQACSCPSDEEIAAFARDTLFADERAQVRQHLDTCKECCQLVAALVQKNEVLPMDSAAFRRLPVYLAVAACTVGFSLLVYFFLIYDRSQSNKERLSALLDRGDLAGGEIMVRKVAKLPQQFSAPPPPVDTNARIRSSGDEEAFTLREPVGKILCTDGRPMFRWRRNLAAEGTSALRVRVHWVAEGVDPVDIPTAERDEVAFPETGTKYPPLPRTTRIQWRLVYRDRFREVESEPHIFHLAPAMEVEQVRQDLAVLEGSLVELRDVRGIEKLSAWLRANLLERRRLFLDALHELETIDGDDATVLARKTHLRHLCRMDEE